MQDSPSSKAIQTIQLNDQVFEQMPLFKVKNCENCFVCLIGISQLNSFQFKNSSYSTAVFDFKDTVPGLNFYHFTSYTLFYDSYQGDNNSTWILFGIPNKYLQEDFQFYAFEINNKTFVKLYSNNETDNKLKTSYALYSYDQEIIGVDIVGSIYVWNSSDFTFKYKIEIQEYACLNSPLGELFHINGNKFLILACDNNQVVSYNFAANQSSILFTPTTPVNYIRAFDSLNLIGLAESGIGDIHFFQFNLITQQFDVFLHMQNHQDKQNCYNLQYLPLSQTLFISQSYTNQFIPIQQCLQNVTSCLSCQMNFYFNATEVSDSQNYLYGQGTDKTPYASSQAILQSFIKAYGYIKRFYGINSIDVQLFFDYSNQITLHNAFFSPSIMKYFNLTIQSWNQDYQAVVYTSEELEWSSVNILILRNIFIQFIIGSSQQQQQQCGMSFSNIQEHALIDNVSVSSSNRAINCSSIISIVNTEISLNNISIKNANFSNTNQLISISNSQKILLYNFSLGNCVLHQDFSILSQQSEVLVIIDTMTIENNVCDIGNNLFLPEYVGQLFEAGQYNVSNMKILNNQFCNQLIFSTVSTINQRNYTFSFNQIVLSNNQFYTSSNYLFFNAIYSINPVPQHNLILNELTFSDNSYFPSSQVVSNANTKLTSLILADKIKSVSISQIKLKNHQEIAFCSVSRSSQVTLNNIYCLNDQTFFNNAGEREYAGCISFNEIKLFNLLYLQARFIKGINNSILTIINQIYANSVITLSQIVVENCYFEQNQINSSANPIFIASTDQANIIINNSYFNLNQLKGFFNTQFQSTTGIQIQNSQGIIQLMNNQFSTSKSNTLYNFMYLAAKNITISESIFNQSSFDLQDNNTQFLQKGGCLRIKTQNFDMLQSNFSQSTASLGSFIYFESLSDIQMNIIIGKSQFKEGYAQDGGAFYIDPKSQSLNFLCHECNFINIYTLDQYSSSISIAPSSQNLLPTINQFILFQSGTLVNLIGASKNSYFLNVINSNITIYNIGNISFNGVYPNYLNQIFQIHDLESASFIQSQQSLIQIIDCLFENLIIKSALNMIPLLLNTTNTNIILQQLEIKDSFFSHYLIHVNQGSLSIENCNFTNITNQGTQQRILQQSQINSQNSFNSLIFVSSSQLNIRKQTLFSQISCLECFGSILQMANTTFVISETRFIQSKANHGGALLIQGLISHFNIIQNSDFVENQATMHGGAIHMQALKDDVFTLTLQDCNISRNKALAGNGGALFIRSENASPQQLINIQNTIFTRNQATVGGCIDNQIINPIIDSLSIMLNNQAILYGDNINSYPSHLSPIVTNDLTKFYNQSSDSLVLQNIRSGESLPDIAFQLRDKTPKPVFPVDTQQMMNIYVQFSSKTKNSSNYYIRGNSSAFVDFKQKLFIFQGIQLIGTPDSHAIIEFKSDSIKILNNQTNQYESNYSFAVEVYFRNCTYGEIQNAYNTYIECTICEDGKYSLDNQQCYQCPSGAEQQNIVAIQTAWSKRLSQRWRNKSVQESSSSSRQKNQSQQLSMTQASRSIYSQQYKKSQIQEKGSVYIKMFTNYLQIMGCIITLNPSLTTRGIQQNDNCLVEVSPILFAHQTEKSPALFQSFVVSGVDTNFKQEKEGKFMMAIDKDIINLSQKTNPSNNNTISHKINFKSQQNYDEDIL
ncbi:hypothetical protein ABPG72_007882 [Tetrahymena utriculariae]